jgi:hypothetical protein
VLLVKGVWLAIILSGVYQIAIRNQISGSEKRAIASGFLLCINHLVDAEIHHRRIANPPAGGLQNRVSLLHYGYVFWSY